MIALLCAQLSVKYDKHIAEIVVIPNANSDLKTITICVAFLSVSFRILYNLSQKARHHNVWQSL